MNEKEIDTKPEEEDSEDFGINIHYHQEDESTDNIEDYDEDIPFPENWKRESVESMKKTFVDWIDHHVKQELVTTNSDIFSNKENETRLYFKIYERGGSDQENEVEGYYCVFQKYDTSKVEMTDVKF